MLAFENLLGRGQTTGIHLHVDKDLRRVVPLALWPLSEQTVSAKARHKNKGRQIAVRCAHCRDDKQLPPTQETTAIATGQLGRCAA